MSDEVTKTKQEEISESSQVPEGLKEKTTGEATASTESEPELSEQTLDRSSEREKFYQNLAKGEAPDVEETKPAEGEKDAEQADATQSQESQEEAESQSDEVAVEDRLKQKVQKRISKEVAKRKTAEERATELEAENVRLKAQIEQPKSEASDRDPTEAELDAEYERALSEGDYKYAAQVHRYSLRQEKKRALEEVNRENDQRQRKSQELQTKWTKLVTDFTVYKDDRTIDESHPLNLNNPNSALYRTAMSFFKDPDIAKEYGYDHEDKVLGFRLAVNDARRELMEAGERGELELASKRNHQKQSFVDTKKRRKTELATTESESPDVEQEAPVRRTMREKALSEIERRNKLKEERMRI